MTNKITKLILNGEEYQIREYVEPGWQPGANTIGYRPLAGNTNDYSGNNRHLSNGTQPTFVTSGNLTYGSSSGNVRIRTNSFTMTSPIQTVSCWIMIPYTQTSKWIFNLNWDNSGSTEYGALYGTNYNPALCTYPFFVSGNYKGINPTVNTWYNFITIFNSNDNTCKVYVNGEYKGVDSRAINVGSSLIFTLFGSAVDNDNCACSFSNVILEDKERTDTEISDYFNLTKSLYGIS